MRKNIILIFLTLFVTKLFCFAYEPYIPKGTLVKVYTKIPLSTEHLEEGSLVYFINPADVWVVEKRLIEKGEIFKGYVAEALDWMEKELSENPAAAAYVEG